MKKLLIVIVAPFGKVTILAFNNLFHAIYNDIKMKIFSLIALIVLIASCEKPSDCTDHYFSDQYKSYVYSSPGAYWVYEDTLLGIIDSMNLVSKSVLFNDQCSVTHRPQEELQQTFKSSYFIGIDHYNWIAIGLAEFNSFSAGSPLGYYSDHDGQFIDSMLVHGNWYYDILEFTSTNGKYYWSKNIGVIKKEFFLLEPNDTIYHFELINYYLKD